MKILIITDERTGGTSFMRICGAIIGGLYVDDINTHFAKLKEKDMSSWAYRYDLEHNIGISSYFSKYDKFSDVDIYDMILFLFNNGIDVFKLSINDSYWTTKQTDNLVNSLNSANDNFIKLKLIRHNNFDKILSKCVAIHLFEIIGDEAYDVKENKHTISIDPNKFKYTCKIKMNTQKIIDNIIVSDDNTFVYESFYKNIDDVDKLKKSLGTNKIIDNESFILNYNKDYKSNNVIVSNLSDLNDIFISEFAS